MSTIIQRAKALIVKAAYINELAHKELDLYYKKRFYKKKESLYTEALKILKGLKHSPIKIKEVNSLDQNGYESVLIYFEWLEKGNVLIQFSFHKPGKTIFKTKGTKLLEWTGITNEEMLRKYKEVVAF